MKPQPCFEPDRVLEEAARRAEQRKNQAIERLLDTLGGGERRQPIEAAGKEKGQ